jgi:small subunit ribosomal protein S9
MNLTKIGYGIGRRKTSIAQVILKLGNGKLIINKKEGNLYLQNNPNYLQKLENSFLLLGLKKKFDIYAKTNGGGLTGQTDAILLAIARALISFDFQNRPILKKAGLLKRDSRQVERKKFGLKKARKASQFSKR